VNIIDDIENVLHFRPRSHRVGLVIRVGRHRVIVLELHPNRRNKIMLTVNAGHTINMALQVLDQNGNPMLAQPAFDAPPTWADAPTPAGIDTLTVAAGGASASLATAAADTTGGTDTITVTAQVGGVALSGSLALAITGVAQVPTSLGIVATVV
jgi:hypothetical protein